MLLSEAFYKYTQDVIVFTNQSSKTEEYHNNALKCLLKSLGEDIEVAALTFEHVRRWKIDMVKDGKQPSTIREYIMKLRVVMKYLNKQGVGMDYELILLPRREASVPSFITKEEVAKLIKAMGQPRRGYPKSNRLKNQAVISMLFGSGIRISELCSLNRDSIYQRTFTVIGKGKKPRICFIDPRTEKLLRQYLRTRTDNDPALFLNNQTSTRINPSGVQRMMCDGWKKAGFTKPIHPHTLRHSFATELLRSNTNLRYVSEFLGHSSLETTKIYMHVTNNDLKAVYEAHMKT